MSYITFYGGIDEVGGNKVLLTSGDTRIFLDFGKSHSRWKDWYTYPYEKPRCIAELIGLNLIPKPEGELVNIYTSYDRSKAVKWSIEEEAMPGVSACIYSHAHADHIGCMFTLNRRIWMYMGRVPKAVQQAYYEHSGHEFEKDLTGFIEGKNVFAFKSGDELKFDRINIYPIGVDHSIPGSYGFVIECPDKTIVYTGDLRWHGPYKELTDRFLDRVDEFKPIDYLICDSTPLSKRARARRYRAEDDVRRSVLRLLKGYTGLVVANVSLMDIDRINTLFEVANEVGRSFVVMLKMASMLSRLKGLPIKNFPELSQVGVFEEEVERKVWKAGFLDGLDRASRKETEERERQDLYFREYEYGRFFRQKVPPREMIDHPEEYMLVTSFYSITELRALFEENEYKALPGGGIYILCTSEPHSEELEIDFNVLRHWIDRLGLIYKHRHCSGHLDVEELKAIGERIKPKWTIPIHTDQPEKLRSIAENVKIPEYGVPLC